MLTLARYVGDRIMELVSILLVATVCWLGVATLVILYCITKHNTRAKPQRRSLS